MPRPRSWPAPAPTWRRWNNASRRSKPRPPPRLPHRTPADPGRSAATGAATERLGVGRAVRRRLGQGEEECRAAARLGFRPDSTVTALQHLLADRQADAGAGVFLAAMAALENREQPRHEVRVDADAVIAHGKQPLPAVILGAYLHPRR